MSLDAVDAEITDEDATICEYCGGVIEADGQRCPARHDGECRP